MSPSLYLSKGLVSTTSTGSFVYSSDLSIGDEGDVNPSHRANKWAERCAQIFLLAWLISSLVSALSAVFWFDGYPVNGPFQLYDPLRRIAAGQRAGQDFQFFHGIGIPFLHYPLFWLFGGHSLQASELSRQFTSLLLFIASLTIFIRAACRSSLNGLVRSPWVLAAAAVLILELTFPHSAEPGHSLISGRSALPVVAFSVLLTPWSSWKRALLFGVCIGEALAFGTEHGISLTLALFVVTGLATLHSLLHKASSEVAANFRFLAISLLSAAATATILFVSFAGFKGARQALHYNLSELPMDQFWFFGSPPMPYLTSLLQVVTNHHALLCFFPSFVLILLIVLLLVRSQRLPSLGESSSDTAGDQWRTLFILMLTYGVLTAIPLIGILSRHYVYPQTRVLILLGIVLVTRVLRPSLLNRQRRLFPIVRGASIAFVTLCLLSASTLLYHSGKSAIYLEQHRNQTTRFDHSLDTYWNNFMGDATATIEANQSRPKLQLWSEYAALLDAHYGSFQPAEDYIIHAVGKKRWARYIRTFRSADPEFVTTMTSQFSFAEWLQNERWDFYQELVDNYEPLRDVQHATIWHRRPGPWQDASTNWKQASLNPAKQTVTLAPAQTADEVIVLQVHYTVINPWRKLPLIGATPRYIGRVQGSMRNTPISLPAYESTFRFPVKLSPANPVSIRFTTESFLPGARLEIERAEFQTLPASRSVEVMFSPRRTPSRY